jgi:hypothetical protein
MMMSAPAAAACVGLRQCLHLANDLASGGPDPLGERSGVAERKHHSGGFGVERYVERLGLLLKRPGDEADANTGISRFAELSADRRRIG